MHMIPMAHPQNVNAEDDFHGLNGGMQFSNPSVGTDLMVHQFLKHNRNESIACV